MGLRRWLDPPEVRARKQYLRAAGLHPGRGGLEVGIAVPIGCMVPLAITAAVLVGARGLGCTRLQAAAAPPGRVTVRVICDGAAGGPQDLSHQNLPPAFTC